MGDGQDRAWPVQTWHLGSSNPSTEMAHFLLIVCIKLKSCLLGGVKVKCNVWGILLNYDQVTLTYYSHYQIFLSAWYPNFLL